MKFFHLKATGLWFSKWMWFVIVWSCLISFHQWLRDRVKRFPVMLPCFPTCQVLGFGLLVEWRLQQGGEGNSLWAQVSGPGISNFPWLQAEKAQGSEVKEEGEDPDKEKAPPDFFRGWLLCLDNGSPNSDIGWNLSKLRTPQNSAIEKSDL